MRIDIKLDTVISDEIVPNVWLIRSQITVNGNEVDYVYGDKFERDDIVRYLKHRIDQLIRIPKIKREVVNELEAEILTEIGEAWEQVAY